MAPVYIITHTTKITFNNIIYGWSFPCITEEGRSTLLGE